MRWIALFAALPLLGACNFVVTTEPLFTAADAANGPVLRDGLWLTESADCRVDARKPVQNWPKCAKWDVVRGGERLNFSAAAKGDPAEWSSMPFLLASGEPRILQLAEAPSRDDGKPVTIYVYVGLIPTAHDSDGRITAYRAWMVQCGPPPKGKGKTKNDQTDAPFPGLILNKADGSENSISAGCTTSDPRVLRNAAVASRSLERPDAARWVRDTLP